MYNKLFTKILMSTIWLESTPTRIVWIAFIAAMDENGIVEFSSVANVAAVARVTLQEAQEAIRVLESNDSSDPTQDHGGRRIERVPGVGWLVLNAGKYRDIVSKAVKQANTRERVRRHRSRNTPSVTTSVTDPECNAPVTPSDQIRSDQIRSSSKNGDGADAPLADEVEKPKRRKGDNATGVRTHPGHVPGLCGFVCLPKKKMHDLVNASGEVRETPEQRAEIEERILHWALTVVKPKWEGRAITDSIWQFWDRRFAELDDVYVDTGEIVPPGGLTKKGNYIRENR